MKLSKKILSIVLSVLMVVSMLPTFAISAFAATSASSVTDALNAYSYQTGFTGKYGSYSGDKTSDFASGTTYTTFMRNVLYGETGSSYQTTDTKLKSNGGTGSDSNTHVWVKYPRMTLIYDGTSTELNTPVMVQIESEGENRIVYCAAPANELGLANTSVWYGSDQADNWAWLYSQQKSNDIGQINATAADGKKAQISKTGGFMGIGNYNKKYYRFANMTKFQSTFATNEYYKEISPIYQFYVGSNNTYTQTDIAGTNAVGDPIRYVNYKPIYDRVNYEKTYFSQFDGSNYTDASVSAYYDAIIAMANFDVVNYNSYATHDDVVAAANKIKSLVDTYDAAKNSLVCAHKTTETRNASTATCTEAGYTGDTYCSVCETKLADGSPIAATGHSTSYNSSVKIPATCTTQGTTTYSCKNNCGYSFDVQDIAVNPNAHNMGAYVASADATCENDGQETATCQNGCGHTDTREIADSALGHSFTNYVSNNDATCTADGTKTATCDRVGCAVTDTVPDEGSMLGHSFTNYVSNNDATCTADGTKTATCDDCTATSTITDEGSVLGHSFTNYVSNNDATCTEDGTKTAACDNGCGETDTIPDADSATGHAFTNYVYNNDAQIGVDGTETAACDNGCGVTDTRTAEGTALEAPSVDVNVVDNNTGADTATDVTVTVDKVGDDVVVKAEIKDTADENTKFIGWYDAEGNLVSTTPEYVTNGETALTAKTATAPTDGYSLTLGDQININAYFDVLYYTDNLASSTITVTRNVNNETYEADVQTTTIGATLNAGNEFAVSQPYAPAQIGETVTITITDGENTNTRTYSIADYCKDAIDGSNDKLANLAQSVVNYGKAAQAYFVDCNTPAIDVAETAVDDLTATDVAAYAPVMQQTSACKDDFQVTDMTFMSLYKSAVRFYYEGDASAYTVTVNNEEVNAQFGSQTIDGVTYNYFEISGILAKNLGKAYVIKLSKAGVAGFAAKVSALSYVNVAVANQDKTLQNYRTFLATLKAYADNSAAYFA